MGIAAGAAGFLELAGISQEAPLPRTRQSLLACRGLLDGVNPAEIEGAGRWGRAARLLFVPAQEVPIYLGAMSPKMLALGGGLSDGVLALLSRPSTTQRRVGTSSGDGTRTTVQPSPSISLPACGSRWPRTVEGAETALADKLVFYGPEFSPYLLERVGLTREDFAPAAAGADQR